MSHPSAYFSHPIFLQSLDFFVNKILTNNNEVQLELFFIPIHVAFGIKKRKTRFSLSFQCFHLCTFVIHCSLWKGMMIPKHLKQFNQHCMLLVSLFMGRRHMNYYILVLSPCTYWFWSSSRVDVELAINHFISNTGIFFPGYIINNFLTRYYRSTMNLKLNILMPIISGIKKHKLDFHFKFSAFTSALTMTLFSLFPLGRGWWNQDVFNNLINNTS